MNIILIGYMGSGKTTLGKKLAKRLNMQFMDTDQYIEESQQRTITEIFMQEGESAFREMEKALIDDLAKHDNWVISTGGGMPCYNNLIAKLNSIGATIYLKRSAAELTHRIVNSKKQRPITDNKTPEEVLLLVQEMLVVREPIYQQAHLIADRSIQNATTLANLIDQHIASKRTKN